MGRKINLWWLVAGILALFGAVGHAAYGHSSYLVQIEAAALWHASFIFVHQTTWFMLLSGVLLVFAALSGRQGRFFWAVVFIAAVFGGNFLFFLVSSLLNYPAALGADLAPQLVFFLAYEGCLIMGGVRTLRQAHLQDMG